MSVPLPSRTPSGWRLAASAALTAALSTWGPRPAVAQPVSEDSLRVYTRVLAHDSLRGRRPGTQGERLAAEYLTEKLTLLGLGPLPGRSSMRLPVPLTVHSFGADARVEVRVRLEETRRSATGHNVAAFLPGRDPSEGKGAVLYVAHYDHIGVGRPTAGDSIWNGFADNASGVAVLLEIARMLAADPLPRPVIFLFTTAEEQGLLGATWFAHEPAVPLDRIAGVINVDGGIPDSRAAEWQVAAPDSSWIRRHAAEALEEADWGVRERSIRSDSDHWAFHRRGVPALFLYPGALAEGLRVHTAEDEWRADAPFSGLARYARTALAVGRRLAARSTRENRRPRP